MEVSPGEQIGDYVVEQLIGEGGMAVVYRAHHRTHQHRVAIKLMRPEAARSNDIVQRFEREQRTIAQLFSGHTVRFYAAGRHQGLPFMVLELLRGKDLEETLKRDGPLPPRLAVTYLLQACHSLAEAHAQGIVHRDLKPSNLFLTKRDDGSPCIKVLDFGISKNAAAQRVAEPSLTRAKDVMGSPWYMSPEQMLASKEVDAATDIWALGVTLYQLLSMNIPFAAENTDAVCRRIMTDDPTPLRRVTGHVPEELEATIMRCFKRRRAERWASIADLATALAPFGPEHTPESLARIYEFLPPTHPHHVTASEEAEPTTPTRSTTEADETLYLRKAGAGASGLSISWGVAFASLTFALGAGLGWVMSLDTDPTNVTSRPAPRSPVAQAAPLASAGPVEESPVEESPSPTIDLDAPDEDDGTNNEQPLTAAVAQPRVASPHAAVAQPLPSSPALPASPSVAVAPAKSTVTTMAAPPATPPSAPPPATKPTPNEPPAPRAPEANDVQF